MTQVGSDGDTGPMFSPVSVDRASSVIVDQIKALIRGGQLRAGDRLPRERELCEQFQVGRVTVREALRMLEASGLVNVRVGARGGAFLTTPSTKQVGEGLADLLTLSPLSAAGVTEARQVVELGILPLVIERATDADVEDLLRLVSDGERAIEEGSYTMEISAAFHIRVAACTHNSAIEMLVRSFHGPLLMSLRTARVAAPLMGVRGTQEHRELATAIRARDLAVAIRVMRDHLARTAGRVAPTSAADPA